MVISPDFHLHLFTSLLLWYVSYAVKSETTPQPLNGPWSGITNFLLCKIITSWERSGFSHIGIISKQCHQCPNFTEAESKLSFQPICLFFSTPYLARHETNQRLCYSNACENCSLYGLSARAPSAHMLQLKK